MRIPTSLAGLLLITGLASSSPSAAARYAWQDAARERRPVSLSLTVVALDAAPIAPDRRTEWMPFEVSTSRPVGKIAVEAYPPPGVTLDPIAPLGVGNRRPRVIITAARAPADRDVAIRFLLRPAEDDAAAVEVISRVRVRAPTLTHGVPWLTWLVTALAVLALLRLSSMLMTPLMVGSRGLAARWRRQR